MSWNSGVGLNIAPAADKPGELPGPDKVDFPGTDRKGVLHDLYLELCGEGGTDLPSLEDNLNSLAIAAAVLLSAKEKRVVQLSELL